MSANDVKDTLGAVLIGSGFAAVFVVFPFLQRLQLG